MASRNNLCQGACAAWLHPHLHLRLPQSSDTAGTSSRFPSNTSTNMKATSLFLALLTALFSGLFFTGCATTGTSTQKSRLTEAGFVVRTPETAKQRELYASAPAYQLQRAEVKGRVFYAYKDEANGVVYVGDEADYQRYRQLALEHQIAMEQLAAAEMSTAFALGWYDYYWHPYVPIRPIPPRPWPGPHPTPHPTPVYRPSTLPSPAPMPRPMPMTRPMGGGGFRR